MSIYNRIFSMIELNYLNQGSAASRLLPQELLLLIGAPAVIHRNIMCRPGRAAGGSLSLSLRCCQPIPAARPGGAEGNAGDGRGRLQALIQDGLVLRRLCRGPSAPAQPALPLYKRRSALKTLIKLSPRS